MKKKLSIIFIIVAIAIIIPYMTCSALTSPGTVYQDTGSGYDGTTYTVINNYVKYCYHPGAKLSRYYMYDSTGTGYNAYPIRTPISNYSGEINGWGASEISWATAMNGGSLTDIVPYCYGAVLAFRNTCDGVVTGYGTVTATYSQLFEAYASILKYGYGGIYDQSAAFGFGSTWADHVARYYATNMAMQRLSSQSLTGYDIGTYSTSGVTDLRVTNFSYYLENNARKLLCNSKKIFSNLTGSVGTAYRYNSTYTAVPITISVPSDENLTYYSNYTNFSWANLSNLACYNASSVTSAMASFNNARSVSSTLLLYSYSIKGGEQIAYFQQGKVRSPQTYARMFMTGDPNRQVFLIGDSSSIASTSIYSMLDQVLVTANLPYFDEVSGTITPSAASYNAGDGGTVTVTYTNNTSISAVNVPVSLSCSSGLGTPFTISTPTKTISEIAPYSSVTVTWNVTANTLSGNATATFTSKIGYATDGSTRFNETTYGNNVSTKSVTVKSLPDLQVTSLTTDKTSYDAGETVVFKAVVKNTGPVSCGGESRATISYNTEYLTPADTCYVTVPNLTAGASTTVMFTATANTLSNVATATATVIADSTGVITEQSETNNTRSVNVQIKAGLPDFSCDFDVNDYIAGQYAVVTVHVKNNGVMANPAVPVSLTVNGTEYNDTVPVPVGENLAVFRITVPEADEITISAAADPENVIAEYDEENNTAIQTATASDYKTINLIDADNSALENSYLINNKIIPDTPDSTDTLTHYWQEWRYEGGSYVLHDYYASLTVNFEVLPDSRLAEEGDTIESGFGIEQAAKTTLETNYDHPEKLVGIQAVMLTYPETYYGVDTDEYTGYYEPMYSDIAAELTCLWEYPANPTSILNMPLHYIPLWYPDGTYTVLCTALGAWTPNGTLYADLTGSVGVSGDMYDRVTAVGW